MKPAIPAIKCCSIYLSIYFMNKESPFNQNLMIAHFTGRHVVNLSCNTLITSLVFSMGNLFMFDNNCVAISDNKKGYKQIEYYKVYFRNTLLSSMLKLKIILR